METEQLQRRIKNKNKNENKKSKQISLEEASGRGYMVITTTCVINVSKVQRSDVNRQNSVQRNQVLTHVIQYMT